MTYEPGSQSIVTRGQRESLELNLHLLLFPIREAIVHAQEEKEGCSGKLVISFSVADLLLSDLLNVPSLDCLPLLSAELYGLPLKLLILCEWDEEVTLVRLP